MNSTDFATLSLPKPLFDNLATLDYSEMTPIQSQSLPTILEGKDVIAQGKTGSGKTAAFGLGLLAQLDPNEVAVQGLILCPTRELTDQVAVALRQLARTLPNIKILTLGGGMPFRPQAKSLQHGAHIIVGTPGRIAKHLRKENLNFDGLKHFVLDEADRMLDMGFQEEIDGIIELLPKKRQTLLFSATFPPKIESIAKRIMQAPSKIEVESKHDDSSIQQFFYNLSSDRQRDTAVKLLLQKHQAETTIIFCNTKQEVKDLRKSLNRSGFSAIALHGDLEQLDRTEALVRFSNKSISILVATDVAARGLDIDNVDAVINYHISRDFEVHVHRIGRTGRAGETGIACSLIAPKEAFKLKALQGYLKQEIKCLELPNDSALNDTQNRPLMSSIKIFIGKKQKLRPANILGALTGVKGLAGDDVGKINIFDHFSYVAVKRSSVNHALKKLQEERWKGRPFKSQLIRN